MLLPECTEIKISQRPHLGKEALLSLASLIASQLDSKDPVHDNLLQTKLPLKKWLIAIWLITSHKKGVASTQLARDVGVTQKTAWSKRLYFSCWLEIAMLQHFDTLEELTAAFPDEQTCIRHFRAIRWANGPFCPYCGGSRIYHFADDKTHKCGDCRQRFSIKVGTIFEDMLRSLPPTNVSSISTSPASGLLNDLVFAASRSRCVMSWLGQARI